jgi:1,4-dihydroxy-2-naphthoate octaprenyltransferase
LVCSFLIQIGTNLTNDLYDYFKGADSENRKGPLRVVSAGLISVREMKIAIFICFSLTFLFGLYLVYVTDWRIFLIGVLSILAGFSYTAGPLPLAYNGLGDFFVFIFFGLVGTMGTFYLHTLNFSLLSFIVSLPVGALITNILIVNNYRDIKEDKISNKRTLAVLLGKKFSQYEYLFFSIISFIVPFILFVCFDFSLIILLPILSLPLSIKLLKMLFTLEGSQLNKTLELTAKFSALYGILFSSGIVANKFL